MDFSQVTYHSCTRPSPSPDIESFPQYRPVTASISPNPRRIGILAPSSGRPGNQLPVAPRMIHSPPRSPHTWVLRRHRGNHLPHIRCHPPGTTAIHHQSAFLPRQRRRHCIDSCLTDPIRLLWPAVLSLRTVVGRVLVLVKQIFEVLEGHAWVAKAGLDGGAVIGEGGASGGDIDYAAVRAEEGGECLAHLCRSRRGLVGLMGK